jgi:Flp pilus assembly pilin Flp
MGSEGPLLKEFLQDETGQDTVEYSLLLTLIAAAAVIFLTMLGQGINGLLAKVTGQLLEEDNLDFIRKRKDWL